MAFLIVFASSLALFAPALRNNLLIWDDAGYIWENPHIRSLDLRTISWAFGEYCCNFWAPLTWLSLALDHAVWGLNPVGYHLTSIILHASSAGLFLLLSLELFDCHLTSGQLNERQLAQRERLALWSSTLAALVFSLHPLRVESVAWAAERKDVLGLFFGIPAIIAYVRHARALGARFGSSPLPLHAFAASPYYWLAFALFCLSLLSKPMLVTLPVVLLLLDWFPLYRIRKIGAAPLLAEKALFLLVSVAVTLISIDAQTPQTMPLAQSGVGSRVLNAITSVASYLWLTAWPANTSPFYLHPGNITRIGLDHAAPAVVVILVTAVCALYVRRRPFFMVVWLAYLTALVPVLGFTQVGPQAMAARFTYFPSLPIALLVAVVVVTTVLDQSRRWLSILLVSSTALWLLAISLLTVQHISYWKDDVTLWTRVIDLSPRASGRAYLERSNGHVRRGEPGLALADVNEALAIAKAKHYPALYELYMARAMIFSSMGRSPEALADYSRASESMEGPARAIPAHGGMVY